MHARSSLTMRRVPTLCAMVLFASLNAASAFAQARPSDPRWQPWIGCWTSSTRQGADPFRQVCVVPAAGVSAVDIVTVSGGKIVARERVDASGAKRDTERDGCKGWERAEWSADGRRVFLES